MFAQLLKDYEKTDQAREEVITRSREVIKLSKKVITALHNEDIKKAEAFAKDMKEKVSSMTKSQKDGQTGAFGQAMQEYVEAELFLHFVKKRTLLSYEDMNVTPQDYLLGVCDFTGELQRRAVMKTAKKEEGLEDIHTLVKEIYTNLLDFSMRGEVRKKFDSVKYVMLKMEDIMLARSLKNTS